FSAFCCSPSSGSIVMRTSVRSGKHKELVGISTPFSMMAVIVYIGTTPSGILEILPRSEPFLLFRNAPANWLGCTSSRTETPLFSDELQLAYGAVRRTDRGLQ